MSPAPQGQGWERRWPSPGLRAGDHRLHPLPRFEPSDSQYVSGLPKQVVLCRAVPPRLPRKAREHAPLETPHPPHPPESVRHDLSHPELPCCSSSYSTASASAPPTMSKISLVIACWRTLL